MNFSFVSHAPLRRLWTSRRELLGAFAYWSGVGFAVEKLTSPKGAIILMYHSVASDDIARRIDPRNRISPENFEQHAAFLSRHRTVVPLSEIVSEITSGRSPPAGTVAITFDDGYLDNLTVAAPILAKYRLPATLFLASGYVTHSAPQWSDELHYLLDFRRQSHISLPEIFGQVKNLSLPVEYREVRTALHRVLLGSNFTQRRNLLDNLTSQLAPLEPMPRITLNWEEVRDLKQRYPGFDIGGHTRDHIDLRTHRGELACDQIRDCADDLWQQLMLKPGHFSFPYGRWCEETKAFVKSGHWTSAVGEGDGIRIVAQSDPFSMPRVDAPKTMTELKFKTSGAYPRAVSWL